MWVSWAGLHPMGVCLGVVCRGGYRPFPLASLTAGAGRLGWGSEATPLPPRSPRSSAAGAGPCGWASRARTRPASTPTRCPSTPAPTWCPRAASGPRRCLRSLPTRATSSPSGWTRRAVSSTASMTRPPCSSSTGSARPTHSGPWWMSTASLEASSCWVSAFSLRPLRRRAHLQGLWSDWFHQAWGHPSHWHQSWGRVGALELQSIPAFWPAAVAVGAW